MKMSGSGEKDDEQEHPDAEEKRRRRQLRGGEDVAGNDWQRVVRRCGISNSKSRRTMDKRNGTEPRPFRRSGNRQKSRNTMGRNALGAGVLSLPLSHSLSLSLTLTLPAARPLVTAASRSPGRSFSTERKPGTDHPPTHPWTHPSDCAQSREINTRESAINLTRNYILIWAIKGPLDFGSTKSSIRLLCIILVIRPAVCQKKSVAVRYYLSLVLIK